MALVDLVFIPNYNRGLEERMTQHLPLDHCMIAMCQVASVCKGFICQFSTRELHLAIDRHIIEAS